VSPLRTMVLVLMIACMSFSAFWLVKMVREISHAEGRRGLRFVAVFGGGLYLLHRHSRAVPEGDITRLVFLLLIPANFFLVFLFLRLGAQ